MSGFEGYFLTSLTPNSGHLKPGWGEMVYFGGIYLESPLKRDNDL
jgi:hypothetical protein